MDNRLQNMYTTKFKAAFINLKQVKTKKETRLGQGHLGEPCLMVIIDSSPTL